MSLLLVDTSVWVEHLRGTGSPAALAVRQLLRTRTADLAVTEPVAMELLAGASASSLPLVEQLVAGLTVLSVDPRQDFVAAAAVYRAARLSGRPVRSLVDCLIAVVAVRHDAELVHRDADFEALAEVLADLRTTSLR